MKNNPEHPPEKPLGGAVGTDGYARYSGGRFRSQSLLDSDVSVKERVNNMTNAGGTAET